MTEAEVDRIEKCWTKAITDMPGISVGYFHKAMDGGPIDVAAVCQALRAARIGTRAVSGVGSIEVRPPVASGVRYDAAMPVKARPAVIDWRT